MAAISFSGSITLLLKEATLKKLYREGDRIRLQPANPSLSPVYVDRVEIRGVVRGVLRRYD